MHPRIPIQMWPHAPAMPSLATLVNVCHATRAAMNMQSGLSWPSGLAYRTQVLVLAAECGFESRP